MIMAGSVLLLLLLDVFKKRQQKKAGWGGLRPTAATNSCLQWFWLRMYLGSVERATATPKTDLIHTPLYSPPLQLNPTAELPTLDLGGADRTTP